MTKTRAKSPVTCLLTYRVRKLVALEHKSKRPALEAMLLALSQEQLLRALLLLERGALARKRQASPSKGATPGHFRPL